MSAGQDNGTHALGYLVPAFVVLLALGGQIGLPILVLTFLRSRRLSRQSTFVNFCITMILYSLVFCILIYTGQYRHAQPDHALCVAQSSMIMGALPMVGVAALIVVLHIWATFQGPGSAIFNALEKSWVLTTLIVWPYATFLGFMLGSMLVAKYTTDVVWDHNGLYCFFRLKVITSFLTPIICLVLMALVAILEVVILVQWYRRWVLLKRAFPLADKRSHTIICLRASLFNVYTWLALATSASFFKKVPPAVSYLVEAGLPLATFLVFGTQRDILIAWGIRRGPPIDNPTITAALPTVSTPISFASSVSSMPDLQEP